MKFRKIKVEFSYWESVIPKFCRKARKVRFDDGFLTLLIPTVTSEDPQSMVMAANF